MSEIRISEFLADIMEYSKTIGDKRNAPFTVERFVVAVIDKLEETPREERCKELTEALNVIDRHVGIYVDLQHIKEVFLEYINNSGNAFLDDLDMKKRLQNAEKVAMSKSLECISTATLLECVMDEPNDRIKSEFIDLGLPDEPLETTMAELKMRFGVSESSADAPEDVPEKEEPGNDEPDAKKKSAMTDIVTSTKRLREELHKWVFGQDNAINTFVTGYFRADMLSSIHYKSNRPKATFLFAGPPGVGKTFMAGKAAEALGLPFMRFDMSEYSDKEANLEFCGSDKVYKNAKAGNVTGFVAEHPKCVLLFDEIEKAHTCVINLFLQILDAGRLRDNYTDNEVPFTDTIIILTTNAGKQLYENSDTGDFSTLPRKVIVKALQKDVNPETGAPFFPSAICSRFASGNVVMFNRMSASHLRTIAKNKIELQADSLKDAFGIELLVDENVYTALLFSEGASADARTIRGRSEAFFNDELYELLRLMASGNDDSGIEELEKIHIGVDLSSAKPEVRSLFETSEAPEILVFADDSVSSTCRDRLPSFKVLGTDSTECAIERLKSDDIGFIMLDMRCGVDPGAITSLNIEDVDSAARDFYKFVRENRADIPVYLIEKDGESLAEEERITFLRQGVRGVIHISESDDTLLETVTDISTSLHQQACMTKLAMANKLVTFETSQSISEDGKTAEIKLFDLNLAVAVDAEDSKNVLSSVSKPDVRFDDVIGAADAKRELTYFVEYLKNPKKYVGTGVKAPKGVLLYGPPGTGKTMLAKAMAKESDVTFIAAEGNQFLKKYVGEGPEKVHELFNTARKYAPSILFIDEIDAIAKERRGSSVNGGSSEETLTAFLTEMDGFTSDASKPVFVLAATNFDVEPGGSKSLDPALMRRFDRRVYIELPGKEDRIKFLRMKIAKNQAFDISEEQIENIAIRSTGMSLAELDSAMELALRSAIREGSTRVTDSIFEEAFETFNNGDTKKWDESQLERVARHEAGHAFMCWYSGETPSYLTIVARGNHGGYMQHSDNEGKGIYTKDELLAKIRTSLGGRAAEIAYYGERDGVSSGASGDLVSATNIARQIVCTYGMDSEFGLAVVTGDNSGGAMSIEVRTAVNRILSEQMSETIKIISENKDKIDALVAELMVKNHMSGIEIEDTLKNAGEQGIARVTA